jgi:biotin carboxylase
MNKVFIIFGYNPGRLHHVARLKKLANEKLQAKTLLCKEGISIEDKNTCDYTLSLPFDIHSTAFVEQASQQLSTYLHEHQLLAIGCVSFADRGIPLGSYFAEQNNLTHDCEQLAFTCVNKAIFRQQEKEHETPNWYKKPHFEKLYFHEDAFELFTKQQSALFLKPIAEGNSRGCLRINALSDLENNANVLKHYCEKDGVLAEEQIQNCEEYSVDGVAGRYVVIAKEVMRGPYPIEMQHIIPADISATDYQRLLTAGKIVAEISGSKGGAIHHELFFNKSSKEIYCVEPNRRPAGMNIWDLIKIAIPEYDFWNDWVDWAAGKPTSDTAGKPICFSGCRKLLASKSGKITAIDQQSINKLLQPHNAQLTLKKQLGDTVTSQPKDGSDTLGYVSCQATEAPHLRQLLLELSQKISRLIKVELIAENSKKTVDPTTLYQ